MTEMSGITHDRQTGGPNSRLKLDRSKSGRVQMVTDECNEPASRREKKELELAILQSLQDAPFGTIVARQVLSDISETVKEEDHVPQNAQPNQLEQCTTSNDGNVVEENLPAPEAINCMASEHLSAGTHKLSKSHGQQNSTRARRASNVKQLALSEEDDNGSDYQGDSSEPEDELDFDLDEDSEEEKPKKKNTRKSSAGSKTVAPKSAASNKSQTNTQAKAKGKVSSKGPLSRSVMPSTRCTGTENVSVNANKNVSVGMSGCKRSRSSAPSPTVVSGTKCEAEVIQVADGKLQYMKPVMRTTHLNVPRVTAASSYDTDIPTKPSTGSNNTSELLHQAPRMAPHRPLQQPRPALNAEPRAVVSKSALPETIGSKSMFFNGPAFRVPGLRRPGANKRQAL